MSREPSLTQSCPCLHTSYLHSPRTPLVSTDPRERERKGDKMVKDFDLERTWSMED